VNKGFVLQMASGLAVTGLVAYKLATAPVTGIDGTPISAVAAGFPWKAGAAASALHAATTSAAARDALLLKKAFTAEATSLLGAKVLDLTGRDPESRINVRLSAEAVDFTVLQPNEVFSFNEIVGVRTADRGYASGFMYSNGQVVTGVGGGICITSTVIYNVALETGMKILERRPHSGPVAYAEPGRDSAVAYGSVDLKFKNNTGAVVLIRAIVDQDKLVVAFYGRKQAGREIQIVTEDFEPIPYEVVQKEDETVPEGEMVVEEKGRPGFSVTTVRIIKENGKVVSRELISRDVVRPRNEIVLVHPMPQEPGTPTEGMPDLLPIPMPTCAPPRHEMPEVPLAVPEPAMESPSELPTPEASSAP